jgi:hypothetical protein
VSTALNSGVPLTLSTNSEIASQFDSFTRQLVGMAAGAAGSEAKTEAERKRVFLGIF